MPHASNVIFCDGPDSPHAFDNVPCQPCNGALDAPCPICKGHGQWNTEIDLVSFRSKRASHPVRHGAHGFQRGAQALLYGLKPLFNHGIDRFVLVGPFGLSSSDGIG